MEYEAVIGLEIHVELKTKTKMFCQSLNDPLELHPNVNICPICMGHPGTLPVINHEAVKKVIAVGLALNGTIPEFSQFDRKNYFYPDLPKGYQISQYQHPLVSGGYLDIGTRRIQITRVHLEEDTGRLSHVSGGTSHGSGRQATLVDFNRAGVPLMELVTEPDFRTGEEVIRFGEELQKILRYVGASDADMEKGQMRVEVNISLRPAGQEAFGTKVEVKNINSFKFASDAVDFETKRQASVLDAGELVVQETRGWNENKEETFSQRKKESAHDYRYFPEPDLPPLSLSREMVEEIKASLPELPAPKRLRFQSVYGLDPAIIDVIVRDRDLAGYFENAMSELNQYDKEASEKPKKNVVKTLASLMTGDFLRLLRETSACVSDIRITPENFAELVLLVAQDKISNLAAKQVLEEMFASGDDPSDIIERKGLWQISDTSEIEDMVRHVVETYPKEVEEIRKGKVATLQFLVGQVMKESRGKANPKVVQEFLCKLIG
ncbi:MAG: Asp-tRNA(Asn)/Glu-tRNA(Gln) amidotransferase subunit GatB [Candidatus Sungbacteria bacterium]|nr:Asp-tRNA(Asn)/Glu-tRNA(Gln) amidotransferase subunit GatB [bacterium]MDZ4260258.1 Asp-tRNA(Asn)/Glu-tRNA(Gln) amidotransferase subunit GatB [Candidatus Sungbacteria bacterium]